MADESEATTEHEGQEEATEDVKKPGKNIVVCFDGTNAEYQEHNTNVVRTFEAIVSDDSQVAFYDPGVGTFSILGRAIGRRVGAALGSLFGYGIRQNVEDGYEYLMNTYSPGDRVFLFGFSRGAYTARALAGVIHQFGVLQKGSKNLIPYVWKMYMRRHDDEQSKIIERFKETFSNECKTHFMGLWDTVGTHGPNGSKRFSDTKLNPDVKHGYHAVSIDEKRRPYNVLLWDESDRPPDQVIEQVRFAGVHSEVGGGCTKGNCALPDVSFAWMMKKACAHGLKLRHGWQRGLRNGVGAEVHDSCTFFPWKLFFLCKKRVLPNNVARQSSVATGD
jgi:uncharacterized protein (DUF2235 family)